MKIWHKNITGLDISWNAVWGSMLHISPALQVLSNGNWVSLKGRDGGFVIWFCVCLLILNTYLFLTVWVSVDGFSENIYLFFGYLIHLRANCMLLCSLISWSVWSAHISKAAVYSTYITPNITFREVFFIASSLLHSFWVSWLWNDVLRFFVIL